MTMRWAWTGPQPGQGSQAALQGDTVHFAISASALSLRAWGERDGASCDTTIVLAAISRPAPVRLEP